MFLSIFTYIIGIAVVAIGAFAAFFFAKGKTNEPSKQDPTSPEPFTPENEEDPATEETETETNTSTHKKTDNMVYALLIAIDKYHPHLVGGLEGCVSDSRAIKEYLEKNVPQENLKLLPLYDDQATKENITKGFLEFLKQAGPDDTVFIHYSGHGSQERAATELWYLDPDHLNETIVCYDPWETLDSGGPVTQIADKELGWLISQVAKKDPQSPHVVIVMDCCHSGSGTRSRKVDPTIKVRSSVGDVSRAKPLQQYLFYEHDNELKQSIENKEEVKLPVGRHIALSACRSFELANERGFPEGRYGVFTYHLLKALYKSKGDISYRDLIQQVSIATKNTISYQVPQLYSTHTEDIQKTFLQGSARAASDYYQVIYSNDDDGWILTAGSIQGIMDLEGGESTRIAIYDNDEALEKRDTKKAIMATVNKVFPNRSTLAIKLDHGDSGQKSYKAIITASPLPRTKVFLATESSKSHAAEIEDAVTTLRKAIDENSQAQLFLEFVSNLSEANFQIITYEINGKVKYRIAKHDDERALVQPVSVRGGLSGKEVLRQMMHIARWEKTLKLQNPDTQILPGDVELVLLDKDEKPIETEGNEVLFKHYYDEKKKKWKSPSFKLKIINHSKRNLYCALLYLDSTYSISSAAFPGEWLGTHVVRAGEDVLRETEVNEAYAGQTADKKTGSLFQITIPEKLLDQGITEIEEYFKLIISTEEFSATELEQRALDLPQSTRTMRSASSLKGGNNALNQLFQKVQTRALTVVNDEEEVEEPENFSDWSTSQLSIRVIRPIEEEQSRNILQKSGVKIELPEGVGGKLKVSSMDHNPLTRSAKQDKKEMSLLPAFLNNATESSTIAFNAGTRSAHAELNVLELENVQAPEKVTYENPIKISLPASMNQDEYVLAVANDGELFFPVGFGGKSENGKTEVTIGKLIPPQAEKESTRGLISGIGSTIKIVFQKVLTQQAPLFENHQPPFLRAVSIGEADKVIYQNDVLELTEKVNAAQKIAVITHGFVGDTITMLKGDNKVDDYLLKVLSTEGAEFQPYDLVLAFDYDSYNTSLEDSAKRLLEKLNEIGLKKGHNKQLDFIAHSAGGVLSRWMIQKLPDAPEVHNLLMSGTPNGGTILPKLREQLEFTGSLILNGLDAATLAFPKLALILKSAQLLVQEVDKFTGNKVISTIEEAAKDKVSTSLSTNSDFLKDLYESPLVDGTNYHLLSGSTGLVPQDENTSGILKKIIHRLGLDKLTYNIADLLHGKSNDIVVTNASMSHFPENGQTLNVESVACDHFTYYSTIEGIDGIKKLLPKMKK